MKSPAIFYITDLTANIHRYKDYHFCRGNNSKRKSRIGFIEAGSGEFMHLNKKIAVKEGDIIFIPEKIFCYSEWRGSPDISVTYLSFNIVGDNDGGNFELGVLPVESSDSAELIKKAASLLSGDTADVLSAYSLTYKFLAESLPLINKNRRRLDEALYDAVDYMTAHWNKNFSISDVAEACSVSDSKLYSLFREQLGQTPVAYLNQIKINYALQYLENNSLSITEICELTNFHSEGYFRKVFRDIVGSAPSEYRRKRNRV